jgi:hypothetical protein
MALLAIASQQSNPTEETNIQVHQFLDYMATHPNAKIWFCASGIVLKVHSDASYHSAPQARSHAGGYFFLGSIPRDGHPIVINGAIHITCTILKLIAASAAKAKLGALFLNAQEAEVMRICLKELGHPQPPTPIHIDNTTTVVIVNNIIKRQQSRVMEMQYFWLLDSKVQKLFQFHYQPGQENLGGYPCKHYSANIHQYVQPNYVQMNNSPTILSRAATHSSWQGCIETLGDPYRGKTPLPSVPNYRERDLSPHLIWMDTSNRYEYFPFLANGNHMKLSQPIIFSLILNLFYSSS